MVFDGATTAEDENGLGDRSNSFLNFGYLAIGRDGSANRARDRMEAKADKPPELKLKVANETSGHRTEAMRDYWHRVKEIKCRK